MSSDWRVAILRAFRRLGAIAILALCVTPAWGQGCIMCYSSATAASKKGQQAITRGVLMLLVPPVSMMSGLVLVGLRYGRKRDEENSLRLQ